MNTVILVVVCVSLQPVFIDHILATSSFLLKYQSTAMKVGILSDNQYLLLITCGELFCLSQQVAYEYKWSINISTQEQFISKEVINKKGTCIKSIPTLSVLSLFPVAITTFAERPICRLSMRCLVCHFFVDVVNIVKILLTFISESKCSCFLVVYFHSNLIKKLFVSNKIKFNQQCLLQIIFQTQAPLE